MDQSTDEWIGTEGVTWVNKLMFCSESLPTFVPEKGPKATFPYQGKEQSEWYIGGNFKNCEA
ncbi:hypothetical protein DHD32_12350 [Arenibacter sp. TNZ]|uniref:hypothetical protein n=1 Tax=Arenibacter TaxID=178469 RepID=UPI000CD416A4|nr:MULTISPECIES: hypothetical protein [Arenibacter]MCM4172276.1 hypothetical protein [Arenibacter sp. TNZ]